MRMEFFKDIKWQNNKTVTKESFYNVDGKEEIIKVSKIKCKIMNLKIFAEINESECHEIEREKYVKTRERFCTF